jgi:hypothetical protein
MHSGRHRSYIHGIIPIYFIFSLLTYNIATYIFHGLTVREVLSTPTRMTRDKRGERKEDREEYRVVLEHRATPRQRINAE